MNVQYRLRISPNMNTTSGPLPTRQAHTSESIHSHRNTSGDGETSRVHAWRTSSTRRHSDGPGTAGAPGFFESLWRLILAVAFVAAGQDLYAQDRAQEHLAGNATQGLESAADVEVTLFAAEPMVFNPTNLDVDHRGRVWVMEGFNYRPAENPQNPVREEGDRIVILEDTDGDGRADTETVFYQGRDVDAAMGLLVIGNRAIVAAYDSVFVFTDTDGDDRADVRDILFTGISESVNDHAVHAFVFGPDGKLYFNMGNGARQILDADGNLVVDQAGNAVTNDGGIYREGMVFRMNPEGSRFEVLGDNFRNNYELAVDSYGTIWQSDNDDDGNRAVRINFVMEFGDYGFTDQHTGAGWRTPRTNIESDVPDRHWHQNDPGVVPNLLITGAGSPAGILVYEGRHLPERFHNALIHADAGPNVVRAYPVASDGAGYRARIENLLVGAHDQWFRPVDVATAPDGSVFVADWYDPVLGGHQAGDVESGRIFRISRPGSEYVAPELRFDSPESAVEALANPNLDARYLAWQHLHGRQADAEPALAARFEDDAAEPTLRARALWLLSAIDGHGDRWIRQALSDPNPDLRITAIRAARQFDDGRVLEYVRAVVRDESPAVRREAAIALRFEASPEASDLWAELAVQHDGSDRWYLEALGIGADLHPDARFAAWRERVGADWDAAPGRDVVWRARAPAAAPLLAELILNPATEEADRLRYFRAFDFHQSKEKDQALLSLLEAEHPNRSEITALALRHLDPSAVQGEEGALRAVDEALEASVGTPVFVDLVRKYDRSDQVDALLTYALAHPTESSGAQAVRLAEEFGGMDALRGIVRGSDADEAVAATILLAHLAEDDSPAADLLLELIADETRPLEVRREAVRSYGDGFFEVHRLLALLRDGGLSDALKPVAGSILLNAHQEVVRSEAATLLGLEGLEEKPVQSARQLVAHEGDVEAGRKVFANVCGTCHVLDGVGTPFGPDLSTIGGKLPKEGLYDAILYPGAGVALGYEGQVVQTTDGAALVGYVESRTNDGIVLRMPGGLSRAVRTEEIRSTTEMTDSLMPPVGRALSQQELIDLVEFLSRQVGHAVE